jgi:transposase-like protein
MYTLKQIPSEAQIRKFLKVTIFGKNMYCPQCPSRQVVTYEYRYRCKRCRLKFSLLSHTWLAGMKLSFQKFWLVLWCWTEGVPVRQAVSLTELSEEALYRWYRHFREQLPQYPVFLERIVQLDEAYGKGWSLAMAKQTKSRKVAWGMLPENSVQRHHIIELLKASVKPGSKVNTDGAAIYRTMNHWWPVTHSVDIHKKFEFGQTSEIEGMFGNLRTFIRRMYHHARAENMPSYVSEFCLRFSSPEIFENPNEYLKKTLPLVPID